MSTLRNSALTACLLSSYQVNAEAYPVDSKEAVPAKELSAICGGCHGPEGQDGLDAPALSGQRAWYIERQLFNFRNGTRKNERLMRQRSRLPSPAQYTVEGDPITGFR